MSPEEIETFKASWPCHGLSKLHRVTFYFETNGDLVDIETFGRDGKQFDSCHVDGSALVALMVDAQRKVNPEHCADRGI